MTSPSARDITYAHGVKSRRGKAMIRVIEAMSGKVSLLRAARGYDVELAQGADFWEVLCRRYGIGILPIRGGIEDIPRDGPLVVVANHPYGILDGLVMGRLLSQRRPGRFRILVNSVFTAAPELRDVILPISFDQTPEALKTNLTTRAKALELLAGGGAIGVFPGGTVSTSERAFGQPLDPVWRNFTAKMIAKTDASVLPLFFEGSNSRLFQVCSHLHYTFRLGLLLREFRARTHSDVRLAFGDLISPERLSPYRCDQKAMMDFLRKATYDLSPSPIHSERTGYEFEARYRRKEQDKAHGSRDIR